MSHLIMSLNTRTFNLLKEFGFTTEFVKNKLLCISQKYQMNSNFLYKLICLWRRKYCNSINVWQYDDFFY